MKVDHPSGRTRAFWPLRSQLPLAERGARRRRLRLPRRRRPGAILQNGGTVSEGNPLAARGEVR